MRFMNEVNLTVLLLLVCCSSDVLLNSSDSFQITVSIVSNLFINYYRCKHKTSNFNTTIIRLTKIKETSKQW